MARKLQNPIPLVFETYPESYTGLPFITTIRFRQFTHALIVDNATATTITGYVLDDCSPSDIDIELLLEQAQAWHDTNSSVPLSIHLTQQGLAKQFSSILRPFPIDFISRVIGPVPMFNMALLTKKAKKYPHRPIIRLPEKLADDIV